MKAKFKKSGSNGFTINLNCTHCGKPINRTSVHFGMDCEDGCSEKQYSELLSPKGEGLFAMEDKNPSYPVKVTGVDLYMTQDTIKVLLKSNGIGGYYAQLINDEEASGFENDGCCVVTISKSKAIKWQELCGKMEEFQKLWKALSNEWYDSRL